MKVKITVPATTANLGSGFDTIGMALDLYNHFTFFQGENVEGHTRDNLIYRAADRFCEQLDQEIEDLAFTVESYVPQTRGLGSSATCIIGGMMGANELLGRPLTEEEILVLATDMEGHPDNVAPALYGGCIFSSMENDQIMLYRVENLNKLMCYVAIPNFEVSTSMARDVLPHSLSYEDAVYNVSRIPFLLKGLHEADVKYLKLGTKDRLHEPYRKKLIHGYDTMKKIEDKILGSMVISGAGPTLLFLTDQSYPEEQVCSIWQEISKDTDYIWDIRALKINETGAKVE